MKLEKCFLPFSLGTCLALILVSMSIAVQGCAHYTVADCSGECPATDAGACNTAVENTCKTDHPSEDGATCGCRQINDTVDGQPKPTGGCSCS